MEKRVHQGNPIGPSPVSAVGLAQCFGSPRQTRPRARMHVKPHAPSSRGLLVLCKLRTLIRRSESAGRREVSQILNCRRVYLENAVYLCRLC